MRLWLLVGCLALAFAAVVVESRDPGSNVFWWLMLGAVVAGLATDVAQRRLPPAIRREVLPDVVGIRIAFDADAATPLLAQLRRALAAAEGQRLAQVASALLAARRQWQFAAVDATKPLPEERAQRLFDAWTRDVRQRYAARPGASIDPFRASRLVVVCLHVETLEEIPDLAPTDADGVEKTLGHLARAPRTVRSVDLWSSSALLDAAELARIDNAMLPVSRA